MLSSVCSCNRFIFTLLIYYIVLKKIWKRCCSHLLLVISFKSISDVCVVHQFDKDCRWMCGRINQVWINSKHFHWCITKRITGDPLLNRIAVVFLIYSSFASPAWHFHLTSTLSCPNLLAVSNCAFNNVERSSMALKMLRDINYEVLFRNSNSLFIKRFHFN